MCLYDLMELDMNILSNMLTDYPYHDLYPTPSIWGWTIIFNVTVVIIARLERGESCIRLRRCVRVCICGQDTVKHQ